MELPTSALLARMERHGIAADRAHLEAMEQQFAGAVQQAVKEAHAAVGPRVQPRLAQAAPGGPLR